MFPLSYVSRKIFPSVIFKNRRPSRKFPSLILKSLQKTSFKNSGNLPQIFFFLQITDIRNFHKLIQKYLRFYLALVNRNHNLQLTITKKTRQAINLQIFVSYYLTFRTLTFI